jgi:predicted dehydrogenase
VAIDAMNAGKDVYCEKPLTLTIREGQQILEAQKKTKRVMQVGTQQRTEFGQRFAQAAAMMRDNRVGDVKQVTVCIGGSRDAEVLPKCDPPKSLNWDMWLGQCPMVDYRAQDTVKDVSGWGAGFPFGRAHRYYRWFYEYSGGKLTDWGAHHVDVAMWALNKLGDDIGKVVIDPMEVTHPCEFVNGMPQRDDMFNCATKFNVKCTFADGIEMFVRNAAPEKGFDNGIMFEGSRGRFLVNRGKIVGRPVEDLKSKPLPSNGLSSLYVDDATGDGFGKDGYHMKNFMQCIKTKKTPASDVQSHHRMLNVCHAINVALRLGRKVEYDPKTETFGSDSQANSFIEREQRKGYEINV